MNMVIITTKEQMQTMIDFLDRKHISTLHLKKLSDKLPICVNPINGGWTDSFNRMFNYIKFEDFIKTI